MVASVSEGTGAREKDRGREKEREMGRVRERCPCKYTSVNPARQTCGGAERERGFDFDLR